MVAGQARTLRVLFLLAASVAVASPAAAHPDLLVASGTPTIPAQSVLIYPVEVHYHRLVGHVKVVDPPGASLSITVNDPTGGEAKVAGPGTDLQVNALLRCCIGQGWATRTVVVRNTGFEPAFADLRLVLLHDGTAVGTDDAERGASVSLVLFFALPSAVLAHRWWRGPPPVPGLGPTRFRTAAAAFGGLLGIGLLLAAVGMARYGGGPVVGTLAATADLPWTGNLILTTHSVLTLLVIALWIVALVAWTGAARRAGPHERRRVGLLGVALGLTALAVTVAWAVEYQALVVPALVAVCSAVYPLAGAAALLRARARQA